MNQSDLINGVFEFMGALFIMLHIKIIIKDKSVKGVSILATSFFTSWGIWNLYFYPSNDLIFSFIGGIAIALTNSIYVILLIYYSKFYKI